jgi:UPF0176 protein
MSQLRNKQSKEACLEDVKNEDFKRISISFYRYANIENPDALRDELYRTWQAIGVLGRIYLAKEGINAQLSIPKHQQKTFRKHIDSFPFFKNVPFKIGLEEKTISFWKLAIKVRDYILADGLPDGSYDLNNVGKHLSAEEFNEAMGSDETIVVDMRNAYESVIGHFKGAVKPRSNTFREELPMVAKELKGNEEKKILLYCTGGIRCEKTSAFLKDKGFKDVNQLEGGVINYVHQVKTKKLETKFIGENFVFDGRRGETVTDDLLGTCMNCETATNDYTDCNNKACHVMFLQCEACGKKMDGCCSAVCKEISSLPAEVQKEMRRGRKTKFAEKAC